MVSGETDGVVDSLILRFVGEEEDGTELHELRAAHAAEVLRGVVELSSDFSKAGAFGDGPATEVLVRPASEGSFILEVVRWAEANYQDVSATGVPSLGVVIWWATRSIRAGVKDFDHLENGNVKVVWQDDTAEEVPLAAWNELRKRKRRRKKQLREIMAPLSDERVNAVEVTEQAAVDVEELSEKPVSYILSKPDYNAARPEEEIEELHEIFETEAQMSAIDFDNPEKWRVKTTNRGTRTATVEDEGYLDRITNGLAIRKTDIFWLRVREDTIVKDGRTTRKWIVLQVTSRREATDGDDS